MKKVIAAFNMTLDGYCDHTSMVADEEMHNLYADLINNADCLFYGRRTYQLMEYWRTVIENPTGDKSSDDFALAIDKVPKIVFSQTLKSVDWKTAKLATQGLREEVVEQRLKEGKDMYVCSPSLIVQLANLNLIDEFQLCVHPIIAGSGLTLFKGINDKIYLKLIKTRTLNFGGVILYYEPSYNI